MPSAEANCILIKHVTLKESLKSTLQSQFVQTLKGTNGIHQFAPSRRHHQERPKQEFYFKWNCWRLQRTRRRCWDTEHVGRRCWYCAMVSVRHSVCREGGREAHSILIYSFPFRAFIAHQQLSSWLLEVFGEEKKKEEKKGERAEAEGTEILEQSADRAQLEKLGVVFYSAYELWKQKNPQAFWAHKFPCWNDLIGCFLNIPPQMQPEKAVFITQIHPPHIPYVWAVSPPFVFSLRENAPQQLMVLIKPICDT